MFDAEGAFLIKRLKRILDSRQAIWRKYPERKTEWKVMRREEEDRFARAINKAIKRKNPETYPNRGSLGRVVLANKFKRKDQDLKL